MHLLCVWRKKFKSTIPSTWRLVSAIFPSVMSAVYLRKSLVFWNGKLIILNTNQFKPHKMRFLITWRKCIHNVHIMYTYMKCMPAAWFEAHGTHSTTHCETQPQVECSWKALVKKVAITTQIRIARLCLGQQPACDIQPAVTSAAIQNWRDCVETEGTFIIHWVPCRAQVFAAPLFLKVG